jgi:hypothetical protein
MQTYQRTDEEIAQTTTLTFVAEGCYVQTTVGGGVVAGPRFVPDAVALRLIDGEGYGFRRVTG